MQRNMKELIKKVEQWGDDKGLGKTDPFVQAMKIVSEFGELSDGLAKKDKAEIIDACGDVIVTIIINNKQLGLDFKFIEDEMTVEFQEALADLAELVDLVGIIKALQEDDMNFFVIERYEDKYKERCQSILNFVNQKAWEQGFTFEQALQVAYDEIKDRKGVTKNGTFIKE